MRQVPGGATQLEDWLAAIASHEPGRGDAPARALASWAEDDLQAVVGDLERLGQALLRAHERFRRSGSLPDIEHRNRTLTALDVQRLLGLSDEESQRGDVSRLAMRGVVIHTDIATDRTTRRGIPFVRGRTDRTAVLADDGRDRGVAPRGPHWDIAQALLDLVPPGSSRDAAKRSWYAAAAAYLHRVSSLADMVPHIERALSLYPSDPEILFYAGSMHETLASPAIQHAARHARLPPGTRLAVSGAESHLRQARACFTRALEARPEHVEARVRLGRVLGALDRPEEAIRELQRAAGSATRPLDRYYALLFSADALVALGEPVTAAGALEEAADLFPRAQSPRLALSALLRGSGEPQRASDILLPVLTPAAADPLRDDPWWHYFSGGTDDAARLLREWRISALEMERR